MSELRRRLPRIVAVLAVAVTIGGPQQVADGAAAIEWRGDLGRAKEEACARERLVWVQFTGRSCPGCRKMEVEAFRDAGVIALASTDFLVVRLAAEENEELALGFGLSALPATVILGPDGKTVARAQGYLDADGLRNLLLSSLTTAGRPPSPTSGTPTPVPSLAMDGFCAVSLVDAHRLVPGGEAYTDEYAGRHFRFAGEVARNAFRKSPERYAPANGGRCPVAEVERSERRAGSPRWGALYQNRLFLCGDAKDRARFLARPERYAHVDDTDLGFCPHCLANDGLLVRGSPSHSLSRDGHRYLFPDESHLEAFRSSADIKRR